MSDSRSSLAHRSSRRRGTEQRAMAFGCAGERPTDDSVGSVARLTAGRLWADLANEHENVELEPLSTNDDGEGSFRFRYLLPLAVEAQFYASLL